MNLGVCKTEVRMRKPLVDNHNTIIGAAVIEKSPLLFFNAKIL